MRLTMTHNENLKEFYFNALLDNELLMTAFAIERVTSEILVLVYLEERHLWKLYLLD